MQCDKKTEQLVVRIEPQIRRKLEAAATRQNRTLSDYIRQLLVRSVRRSRVA